MNRQLPSNALAVAAFTVFRRFSAVLWMVGWSLGLLYFSFFHMSFAWLSTSCCATWCGNRDSCLYISPQHFCLIFSCFRRRSDAFSKSEYLNEHFRMAWLPKGLLKMWPLMNKHRRVLQWMLKMTRWACLFLLEISWNRNKKWKTRSFGVQNAFLFFGFMLSD